MSSTEGPAAPHIADAARGNWVDRRAPASLRPYLHLARVDRPIGTWLLLLPCWWSTALAAVAAGSAYPDPRLLVLFAIGSLAMRGAGCTWNDILDRDIDGRVARTRNRPIASGAVSVPAAFAFLAAQCLVGLAVLLSLPRFAIVTGIASLGVVAVYPLMKRITSFPQVVLGIAFSWGALMGWASVFRAIEDPALFLFAGCVVWVFAYDTIYAHQDKEDDAIVGVRSTALFFGRRSALVVGACYAVTVGLFALALDTARAGPFAFIGLAGFALHLAWQVRALDIDDPARCLAVFKSNRDAGLILFAGLALDTIVPALL
ncbi:4-hydroxybenzoate octaprenyltransferase [Xanthobacter tagetidis]|uniref:4-hydroxybenzoate octaprenyltransferase n=1 Tax=Xanthobacter tagetidis TaxID=60216 RepID=A0A3L7A8A6_9HYPH|nr:4-hydroxybenzoate octaprenyltransferase [Xanthobacter tagetidis]MBB6307263.1 4-hydroxybenzoate polyprenyltransferase [Xanthobacter tagetidis]RLP75811.1 4-hydroxybenzoate octaprenyltransferase [Xanthobacter tagetidis]